MSNMQKFIDKIPGFEAALQEIKDRKKKTHWIWYYIPTPEWPKAKPNSMNDIYALKGNDVKDFMRNDILFTNYITMVEAISYQLNKGNDTILSTDDDNSTTQHGDLEKFLSSTEHFSTIVTDRNYVAILHKAIENAKASLDRLFQTDEYIQIRKVITDAQGSKEEEVTGYGPVGHDFEFDYKNYDYKDYDDDDDDYDYYDENSQPLKGSFRRCYNLKRGKNGGWCAKYLGNC